MEKAHSRQIVITGNWKMYKTIDEAERFIKDLSPLISQAKPAIYLAVPFTALSSSSQKAKGTGIHIGAQNMNECEEGAFTGEIAGRMLVNAGAEFVILGHSERRMYFHETDQAINKKIKRALKDGLQPVLCIGETLKQRETGQTHTILESQLTACLEQISSSDLKKIIVAYEPVWAIGTGKVAHAHEVQEIHHFCREFLGFKWGKEVSDQLTLQYGGSVKPENAAELLHQEDIDGLLIGGASLSVESFVQIINLV